MVNSPTNEQKHKISFELNPCSSFCLAFKSKLLFNILQRDVMFSSQNCSWFTTKWPSHPAWSLNPGDERVVHGQSAAGSEHEDLGEQEEEQGGGQHQHGWTTSGEGGVADTLVSVWAFWRKVGRRNVSNLKGSTYKNQVDPGDFFWKLLLWIIFCKFCQRHHPLSPKWWK